MDIEIKAKILKEKILKQKEKLDAAIIYEKECKKNAKIEKKKLQKLIEQMNKLT